jgi:hypothetical protein
VGLNVMCSLSDVDENSSGLTDCKNSAISGFTKILSALIKLCHGYI